MGGMPPGACKKLYGQFCRIFPLDTERGGEIPVYPPCVIHNRGVDNHVENVDKP